MSKSSGDSNFIAIRAGFARCVMVNLFSEEPESKILLGVDLCVGLAAGICSHGIDRGAYTANTARINWIQAIVVRYTRCGEFTNRW